MPHSDRFSPNRRTTSMIIPNAEANKSLPSLGVVHSTHRSTGNPKRLLSRMSSIPSLVMHQLKGKHAPTSPLATNPSPKSPHNRPARLNLALRKRSSRLVYPMTPNTPIDMQYQSPALATGSSYTITLMDTPELSGRNSFSFTASPASPPSTPPLGTPPDSMEYPLPFMKGDRRLSVQTMPSPRRSSFSIDGDHVLWSPNQFGPMIFTEGPEYDADDWRQFHVHFLQDDPPFPITPC